jgi:rubrerythrin
MKDIDIIKDILYYRISNQVFYNENIIDIRNPEARQLFTQMRDDEMRSVSKLQQKIERWESAPFVVSKMFPTLRHY